VGASGEQRQRAECNKGPAAYPTEGPTRRTGSASERRPGVHR
jgi:hypothetical protein